MDSNQTWSVNQGDKQPNSARERERTQDVIVNYTTGVVTTRSTQKKSIANNLQTIEITSRDLVVELNSPKGQITINITDDPVSLKSIRKLGSQGIKDITLIVQTAQAIKEQLDELNTSLMDDEDCQSGVERERQPFSATNLARPTQFTLAQMQTRNATKMDFKTDTGGRDLKPRFANSQIGSPTNLVSSQQKRSLISKRVMNLVSGQMLQAGYQSRDCLNSIISKKSVERQTGVLDKRNMKPWIQTMLTSLKFHTGKPNKTPIKSYQNIPAQHVSADKTLNHSRLEQVSCESKRRVETSLVRNSLQLQVRERVNSYNNKATKQVTPVDKDRQGFFGSNRLLEILQRLHSVYPKSAGLSFSAATEFINLIQKPSVIRCIKLPLPELIIVAVWIIVSVLGLSLSSDIGKNAMIQTAVRDSIAALTKVDIFDRSADSTKSSLACL